MIDTLKSEISDILRRALAGYLDDFKLKHENGNTYIRWGRVEKALHDAVDRHPNNKNEADAKRCARCGEIYFDPIGKDVCPHCGY